MTFPMPMFMPAASLSPAAIVTTSADLVSSSSSPTVTLPSGITSGDLLLLFVNVLDTGGTNSVNTPSGWTKSFGVTPTIDIGTSRDAVIFSKTATGSEGSTLGLTLNNSGHITYVGLRISPWSDFTVNATGAQAGSTSTYNCPSVTASWGSEENLFLAAMYCSPSRSDSVAPSGYTFADFRSSATVGGGTFVAQKTATAASDDPAAASFGFSDADWAATTMVIRGG